MPAFLKFYGGAIRKSEYKRLTWGEWQRLNEYRERYERKTQAQIAAMRGV